MESFEAELTLFFDRLAMDSDRDGAHCFKSYLRASVMEFTSRPNKETAFDVYRFFCDSYRVRLPGQRSFLDLLDTLKSYEENAATLLDKQRDHYVHSVQVFLIGLSIYASNHSFQDIFRRSGYEERPYPGRRSTADEEFLFQWGLAALFHDIGYPMEITSGQVKKFVTLVAGSAGQSDPLPFVGYGDFAALNSIEELLCHEDYAHPFYAQRGPGDEPLDPTRPLDLLAWDLSRSFSLSPAQVKSALDGFLPMMQERGFVDHGFYSALILLKWYGALCQRGDGGTDLLFGPVLSAAGAILLHNYYKNALQKPPFSLGCMSPAQHPLAFLLILCDELQEWNREAYGVLDKQRVLAADSEFSADENRLSLHYHTYEGTLAPDFAVKKEQLFHSLLDIKAVFPGDIRITCTTKTDLYVARIQREGGALLPRPLLENLEQMARTIHQNYNLVQAERHPGQPLEYPDWEGLPDTLKYSNIRQALAMFDKLRACGYVTGAPGGCDEVSGFTPEEIERLARTEHDSWMDERTQDGWKYGPVKDVEKKLSPYLLPYDALTEEIKELDRDAVRNVFPLLRQIGLAVYQA